MCAAKLVCSFYGRESYIVFSYIQGEGGLVRDDALACVLKLTIKDVRRIVNGLKVVLFWLVLSAQSINWLAITD